MKLGGWKTAGGILLALAFAWETTAPPLRAEETFGQAVKRVFHPTPTPHPKKTKRYRRKKSSQAQSPSPTETPEVVASPVPTATPEIVASPSPTATETPSPSPAPQGGKKKKHSASPTPSPSATPEETPSPSPTPQGKKKKHSASPTPSPSATPEETPSPSPTPQSKKKKHSASPTPSPSATPEETPSPSPTAKGKKKKSEETPSPSPSATPPATPSPSPNEKKEKPGGVSIPPNEITGFDSYPEPVKKLITSALELASRNLSYKYGSADPASGGMDCSGFVYYLLKEQGIANVPRDSSELYVWVRKSGKFEAVVSRSDDTFELANLKPGDLMFWTGTYDINRDPPITHAMIYLGREKSTGRRIMVGASDGRTYHDESRYGVSVFDFRVSRPGRAATNGRTPDFVGYGKIPGLGDG